MLSIPPAIAMSIVPAIRESCAAMTLFIPEPQTLLTVVAGTVSGMPARSAAWRAGACPIPAGSTQPIKTSSTSPGSRPLRSRATAIARAPRSGARKLDNAPWKAPIAVRAAPAITTGSSWVRIAILRRC
jgi:hypothetical protein